MLEILTKPSGTDPKKLQFVINTALDPYNVRYPDYDTDTVTVLIKKHYGVEMHESVKTKLKAYRTLFISDAPFEHWHVFEKVVNALIDGFVDVEHVQPPTDVELVLSVYVINRDTRRAPSREVKDYVRVVWQKHLGYSVLHPVLMEFLKHKITSNDRAVLDKLNEYLVARPQTFPTPQDEVEGQAQRLYRLSVILGMFKSAGEIPLELINPTA